MLSYILLFFWKTAHRHICLGCLGSVQANIYASGHKIVLRRLIAARKGEKNSTSHTCKGKLTLKDGVVTNFLNETNKTGQKMEQKS